MDIRSILGEGRCYVELGLAITPSAPSVLPGQTATARMVQLQLVPSGRLVEARVANVGQGTGKGIFAPILAGDEVIVLFPAGDPNRAVVLGGLGNGKSPNPVGNDQLSMLVQHPGGVRLVAVDGLPEYRIVHVELLSALSGFLAALDAFMTTSATATGAAAPVAAAATTYQTSPAVIELEAGLQASINAGPPYASALHKVT